ncbi:hypothetical protein L0222_11475 [bacterium]|nr:hypothetical protein [bacterium]MCI0606424.1 hypothetical protein [bacterium]
MKRKLTISVAVLILFILLFATGSRIHGSSVLNTALARYEKEAGPVVPHRYAPPAPTPENRVKGDNIAIWLKAGAELVYMTMKEKRFLDELIKKDYRNLSTSDKSALLDLLNRNDVALEVLRRVTRCQNSSFELEYNAGFNMQIPRYLQMMYARSLLDSKARLHLAEGQLAEAINLVAAEERIAAALQHDPVLIGGLVGLAVEKDYHEMVHVILPQADQSILAELMQQMQHLKTMTLPASRFLAAEGAVLYHSFNNLPFSSLEAYRDGPNALPWVHRFFKRQLIANSLDLYADYVSLSKRPYQSISKNEWTSSSFLREELRKALFPNVSNIVERFQSAEAARILSSAAVELCLKGHTEGGYPASLAPLTSPYTGEPSAYSVHSDGSATLSFPKDDAFWDSNHKGNTTMRKPRFVWNLPAVKTLSSK